MIDTSAAERRSNLRQWRWCFAPPGLRCFRYSWSHGLRHGLQIYRPSAAAV